MAHIHSVYDTDKHFTIDPASRALVNQTPDKACIMQYDHNSERITFDLPAVVEGHNILDCNRVEVHYLNIDAQTKEPRPGLYEVDDLQLSPADKAVAICSWLISGNGTQLVGPLYFRVTFKCVTGGNIDYSWSTAIYKGLTVSDGINCTEYVAAQYADVLAQWKDDLIATGGVTDERIADTVAAYMEENPVPGPTDEQVAVVVEEWLGENFAPGDNGTTDASLSVGGMAADAKATGAKMPTSADVDDSGLVAFKNARGVTLFTLDLAGLGGDAYFGNLVVSADSLEIAEGGSGTFEVYLETAPSHNQPVYLAVSDNTRLSVSPSTLTFTPTNYATPQIVTVTAAQDEDEENESITVTLTSRKVDAKQLLVSIVDDDKPVLVEDGLEFYINLRNMADQNSADTQIVDSVGGVVCTTQNVAFDGTSGFVTNEGLMLPVASSKLQLQYPVKTENAPNGFTYEITTKGTGTFAGAGNGFGNGYAYNAWLHPNVYYSQFYDGLAHHFADGTNSHGVDNTGRADDVDWTQEHTISFVNEVDGTFNTYVDGVLKCVGTVKENFVRYNISGTITFKIPYSEMNVAPMEVAAVRIYERALTADEVLQNAKYDISQRAVQTF